MGAGLRQYRNLAVIAGTAAFAAFALSLVHSTSGLGARGFCKTNVVRDYTRPLAALPALPPPPFDGHLPFGPQRVFLSQRESGPLQVGAGVRGFGLSFSPDSADSATPSPPLNWLVTATLVRIDRAGTALEVLGRIEDSIERLQPTPHGDSSFLFAVPPGPGLYRLEIDFQDERGASLATYGEYFRSLRPSTDIRLRLNRREARAGDAIDARLVNLGAAYLRFGLGKTIEFYDGSSWVPAPQFTQGNLIPAIALGVGPGESRMCWGATVKSGTPPGLYRFVIPVQRLRNPPAPPKPVKLTSTFRVEPG